MPPLPWRTVIVQASTNKAFILYSWLQSLSCPPTDCNQGDRSRQWRNEVGSGRSVYLPGEPEEEFWHEAWPASLQLIGRGRMEINPTYRGTSVAGRARNHQTDYWRPIPVQVEGSAAVGCASCPGSWTAVSQSLRGVPTAPGQFRHSAQNLLGLRRADLLQRQCGIRAHARTLVIERLLKRRH